MFLGMLREENKKLFLKVCVHAALANGMFADEEKEMISAYCQEMNIPVFVPDVNDDIDSLLAELAKGTDKTEKNIIFLETLGLVRADGIYDDKEKAFMEHLVKGMGIREEILNKYNNLLEKYTAVYKELFAAICE